jgi:hypothetical protein
MSCFIYLIIIIILLYTFREYLPEGFVNKEDRVLDIQNWFSSTPSSSQNYAWFKKKVDDSDIVEYNAAKQLYSQGNLTPENLLNKI